MATDLTALYERFKAKCEAVSGECYRVKDAKEAGTLVAKILEQKGARRVALLDASISYEGNFKTVLDSAGIAVHTDHYRDVTPNVDAGITQVNYAIAELGTLVQADADADVNQRLCSTLPPLHVALIPTSKLIPTLLETMATIHRLPQIPGFVGFITGPSRTSDIERVLTIGVHGPEQVVVVFVDEHVEEVA